MWQAWLTLPSCLASSKRPTLARMIFCSLVMTMFLVNAEAGRCAPRPLRARPRLMPQPNDTVCQIKSKLLHQINGGARPLPAAATRLHQQAGQKTAPDQHVRTSNQLLQCGSHPQKTFGLLPGYPVGHIRSPDVTYLSPLAFRRGVSSSSPTF